jgi:hypothetical protein
MHTISREQLKAEIDQLDGDYLGLVYRVIRQFPHRKERGEQLGKPAFSQRWHGRLAKRSFTAEELAKDPKLAYLAKRYDL